MGVRQHCMWVWVWVWVGMRSVCVCTPMHAYLTLLFCPPHPLKHTPHTHRMQMVVVPLPPGRLAVGGPAAAALLDLLEHQRELQVCVCGCMCVCARGCMHVGACTCVCVSVPVCVHARASVPVGAYGILWVSGGAVGGEAGVFVCGEGGGKGATKAVLELPPPPPPPSPPPGAPSPSPALTLSTCPHPHPPLPPPPPQELLQDMPQIMPAADDMHHMQEVQGGTSCMHYIYVVHLVVHVYITCM